MSTGTLGKVNDDVATITTDSETVQEDVTAINTYVTSTYPTDQQLQNLVNQLSADATQLNTDILVLTTDSAQPPKPDERVK